MGCIPAIVLRNISKRCRVAHRLIEMLGDRRDIDGDRTNYDNTREWIVPANHYFAMGDNRDNSSDSRGWTVPTENLVGRAEFLFEAGRGGFFEVWNWRFSRYSMASSKQAFVIRRRANSGGTL